MASLSRGWGLGLGLSMRLTLGHRALSTISHTASYSHAQRPMATITQLLCQSPIIRAARSFQTSSYLHAAKKKPATTPNPNSNASIANPAATAQPQPPTAVRTTLPRAGPSYSPTGSLAIAKRIAAREKPTILYECPSHFWMHVSATFAATFCIAYALFHYWNSVANPPEGLPWYVPHMFALICLTMVSTGFWFIWSTAFIVRKITAMPKSALPASYLRATPKMTEERIAALQAMKESPVGIVCELSSMVPFLPCKRVVAAPSEIWLPFRFQDMPIVLHPAPVMPPASTSGIGNILLWPFRSFGRGVHGAFGGLRRGLLRDGFAPLKIKGTRYKVDVMGGKVFDNGKAVDALFPFRPEQFKDTWKDRLFR
ncbi:hypothetical protein BD289DRAFT_285281 [Coniella lustricola]|uniref:Uncharacterized protein n=1 Tax=Coniella lustricola TaxID=2025994 RepID=A0A2T3AK41_9PEZI|nr:hypothetical protein BD289DRAFT_285281 [Coniella lustricola]